MDENFVHADVGIKKDKNMIFLFNTNKDEIIPVGNGSRVRNRCERLGCDGLGVGGGGGGSQRKLLSICLTVCWQ